MAYNNGGYGGGFNNNRYSGGRTDNNGYRSGGYNQSRNGNQQAEIQTPHVKLTDQEYVDRAEAVIKKLDEERKLLTTSKIRNLLSMISSLYDEVRRSTSDKPPSPLKAAFRPLRLYAYESAYLLKLGSFRHPVGH